MAEVSREQVIAFATGLTSRLGKSPNVGMLNAELADYSPCSKEMAQSVIDELMDDEKIWPIYEGSYRYTYRANHPGAVTANSYEEIAKIIGAETLVDTATWIAGHTRKQVELNDSLPKYIEVVVGFSPEKIVIETISGIADSTKETCRYPMTAESLAALATVVGENTRRKIRASMRKSAPTHNRTMEVRVRSRILG